MFHNITDLEKAVENGSVDFDDIGPDCKVGGVALFFPVPP